MNRETLSLLGLLIAPKNPQARDHLVLGNLKGNIGAKLIFYERVRGSTSSNFDIKLLNFLFSLTPFKLSDF